MAEIVVRPRGPYSLALSARLAGDATRRMQEGLFTARCCGAVARAWQSPDGTVTIRSESVAAPRSSAGRSRSTTTTPSSCGASPRSAARPRDEAPPRATGRSYGNRRAGTPPRCLRPAHRLENGTKARAFRDPRATASYASTVAATGLCEPPTTAGSEPSRRRAAPAGVARAARRGARPALPLPRARAAPRAANRCCRPPDRARARPRPVVGRRRLPRGARPLRARARRRPRARQARCERSAAGAVETWETAELLEPYGEWAGLASVYLLTGFARGLIPLPAARAA